MYREFFGHDNLEWASRLCDRSPKPPSGEPEAPTASRPATSLLRYILGARLLVLLSSPLIYSMIVPFGLVDVSISIYQWVCFPIYGIEKVRRADYLIYDRARLPYLNLLEKLNCAYCSYANGLIGYVREIAARTEGYWCAIKHSKGIPAPHDHYREFARYGDATAFRAAGARASQDVAGGESQLPEGLGAQSD